jgi:hypothetical protein
VVGRITLHTAAVEEGTERAREYRDSRYRVCLQEHIEHAGGRRDRVRELGRDRQKLRARPEDGVPKRLDLRARCVSLEREYEHAGDRVKEDRRDEQENEPRAQVLMRWSGRARHLEHLATSRSDGFRHAGSVPIRAVGRPAWPPAWRRVRLPEVNRCPICLSLRRTDVERARLAASPPARCRFHAIARAGGQRGRLLLVVRSDSQGDRLSVLAFIRKKLDGQRRDLDSWERLSPATAVADRSPRTSPEASRSGMVSAVIRRLRDPGDH